MVVLSTDRQPETKIPMNCSFEVTDVAEDRNVARIKGYGRDSWVHASSPNKIVRTLDGKLL